MYSLLCPVSFTQYSTLWIHTGDSMVNNPPANAGDSDLIPGSGRSLEEQIATHSCILAREIPQTEDPGGLQSIGSQKSQT